MAKFAINGRAIGAGHPTYIIAEMSANHQQDIEQAVKILKAAKEAGADAVKLQTYTPDTMTIDCRNAYFLIKGTIWEGRNLHDLYQEAYTPWEWYPKLQQVADALAIDLFSTPFDLSAVDFLEQMNVPVHKIASFENVDIPLIRRIAQTGKPIIMSTGMASLGEIDEAVRTIRAHGDSALALLKCTSAYPAPATEMNLRAIPHLAEAFGVVSGLSDHTMTVSAPVAAVTLGARIIEKHFTLSRAVPGPDSTFSLEPQEFKAMVDAVRETEQALGEVKYEMTTREQTSRVFRRSLFVVKEMAPGEAFTPENVRSIRPGYGLHTRYYDEVMGKTAARAIERGTPLAWDLVH